MRSEGGTPRSCTDSKTGQGGIAIAFGWTFSASKGRTSSAILIKIKLHLDSEFVRLLPTPTYHRVCHRVTTAALVQLSRPAGNARFPALHSHAILASASVLLIHVRDEQHTRWPNFHATTTAFLPILENHLPASIVGHRPRNFLQVDTSTTQASTPSTQNYSSISDVVLRIIAVTGGRAEVSIEERWQPERLASFTRGPRQARY